eukprot:SAG11_NODE_2857_length_2901_cov_2.674875_2_plen_174_part_00
MPSRNWSRSSRSVVRTWSGMRPNFVLAGRTHFCGLFGLVRFSADQTRPATQSDPTRHWPDNILLWAYCSLERNFSTRRTSYLSHAPGFNLTRRFVCAPRREVLCGDFSLHLPPRTNLVRSRGHNCTEKEPISRVNLDIAKLFAADASSSHDSLSSAPPVIFAKGKDDFSIGNL